MQIGKEYFISSFESTSENDILRKKRKRSELSFHKNTTIIFLHVTY